MNEPGPTIGFRRSAQLARHPDTQSLDRSRGLVYFVVDDHFHPFRVNPRMAYQAWMDQFS